VLIDEDTIPKLGVFATNQKLAGEGGEKKGGEGQGSEERGGGGRGEEGPMYKETSSIFFVKGGRLR
jgi:hypothetical protein